MKRGASVTASALDCGRGALTPQRRRSRGGGTPPTSGLPVGMKAPVARVPRRLVTTADVIAFQRLMMHALVRPLTAEDGMQATWIDGRPMAEVAEEFIKPTDRLSAFERLELYNRMYWFRLIDILHDDNPGLRALLGRKKFTRLVEAYLAKYPSRSFTLRNLGSRLVRFLREEPALTAPRTALAVDIARFEWSQTVAFDEAKRPVITPAEIAATPPERLRLRLQPYLTLLALDHPVDEYVLAVKKRDALRSEASNAVESSARAPERERKVPVPSRARTYLATHRLNNRLFYKRLERPAFLILQALEAGQPLAAAIVAGGRRVTVPQIKTWFATWMELGWLCSRK